MKEQEWLTTCTEWNNMARLLQRKGSKRKWRLDACALCRRIWHLIEEGPCRQAVEASELFADKQLGEKELAAAQRATWPVVKDQRRTQANLAASRVATIADVNKAVILAELAERVELFANNTKTSWEARNANYCNLIRCVLGNPFHPLNIHTAWLTSDVTGIAQAIYHQRAFERMPILADALEEPAATTATSSTTAGRPASMYAVAGLSICCSGSPDQMALTPPA